MYRTHAFHAKALPKDQYITIGDPYGQAKQDTLPRHKGKQVMTQPPKEGVAGMFGRPEYKGEPYVDSNIYLKQVPLDKRKKGFGSRDIAKRDEFTLHIRTEQYRELLNGEQKIEQKRKESEKAVAAPVDEDVKPVAGAGMRTSSTDYGYGCDEVQAPKFGVRSEMSTFFDRSHLS